MQTLAGVSSAYGNGVLHVTTRQDIQVHDVSLDDIHPALVQLARAGLSTKGGGGNTVRNITACYDAGVCAREAFDVSPYALALTELLLADASSYQLPRKYKIAFSGCPDDCAGAMVNDLGFIARRKGEDLGFAAYVGGGMGARSRVADLLEEFVPAGDVYLVAEAVKRVFDKHGNRKNRSRARLRFLIEQVGVDRFRELYEAELAELRSAGCPELQVRELPGGALDVAAGDQQPGEGFEAWRRKNVLAQRQDGFYLVQIALPLGDISANALEGLAEVVAAHGERMARTTQWQNLVIRWVSEEELAALHRKLDVLGLASAPAPILRRTVACAGASTCRLGICLSRGLARAIIDRLSEDGIDLDGLGDLSVHISGCPNSCGRHALGKIGMFGAARRVRGRLVPHYVVQLGGRSGEARTRLAEGKDAIPARNVPQFVADFLREFQESPQYPDYDAFLDAAGAEVARQLAARHKHVPPFEEDKNYYFDWGGEMPFSLAGRGPGECGAGVTDLIEVDLASARDALREGRTFAAAAFAARALLVTRGQEARDDEEAFGLFAEHFLDAGFADESLRALVDKGRLCARAPAPESTFDASADEVAAFVEAVQGLYDRMDQSLRLPTAADEDSTGSESTPGEQMEVSKEADFHGVACPLNYVKTKLLLDEVGRGEVISVLLDEEAKRNVPESAQREGHEVLSVTQEGEQWRVLIRKG
jgi:sulfite reductase (ferredoxin)